MMVTLSLRQMLHVLAARAWPVAPAPGCASNPVLTAVSPPPAPEGHHGFFGWLSNAYDSTRDAVSSGAHAVAEAATSAYHGAVDAGASAFTASKMAWNPLEGQRWAWEGCRGARLSGECAAGRLCGTSARRSVAGRDRPPQHCKPKASRRRRDHAHGAAQAASQIETPASHIGSLSTVQLRSNRIG
jgi:hypothetical protein